MNTIGECTREQSITIVIELEREYRSAAWSLNHWTIRTNAKLCHVQRSLYSSYSTYYKFHILSSPLSGILQWHYYNFRGSHFVLLACWPSFRQRWKVNPSCGNVTNRRNMIWNSAWLWLTRPINSLTMVAHTAVTWQSYTWGFKFKMSSNRQVLRHSVSMHLSSKTTKVTSGV